MKQDKSKPQNTVKENSNTYSMINLEADYFVVGQDMEHMFTGIGCFKVNFTLRVKNDRNPDNIKTYSIHNA